MSNVTLQIAGRDYTVACAEGEEDHVRTLGRLINDKAATMGGSGQSESRQLLYAALLLADELHEAHRQRAAASAPPDPASMLETVAARLESCAAALEG